MLTLYILRHAKSSWEDPSLDDFNRPLNARGEKTAPKVGFYMQQQALQPDMVLCSKAVRARATLGLVMPFLDKVSTIHLRERFYHAESARTWTRFIEEDAGNATSVLLVGHNPALQDLATSLAVRGAAKDIEQLTAKFPTAALAVLKFPVSDWSQIASGGELERVVLSKKL